MQTDETTSLRSGLQATAGAVVGCMLGDIGGRLAPDAQIIPTPNRTGRGAVACLLDHFHVAERPFAALNVALPFVGPRTYKPREVGIARKQMKHWLIGQCGIVAIEKTGPVLCAHHALQSEKRARLTEPKQGQPRKFGEVELLARSPCTSSGWAISATDRSGACSVATHDAAQGSGRRSELVGALRIAEHHGQKLLAR